MRWTRKSIIEEIRRMKSAREELSYSSVEREHLNLTRAAAWHFGNWRGAVEAAGIEYDDIRKYRRWNRERVVARIHELHQAGADLSWRSVSTKVDPALAAAALRIGDFSSWRDAIAAAGLNIENVARYRFWDEARVLAELRAAKKRGESLSSKAAQQRDQPLFCAARRRFGNWNNALQSAGIAPQKRGGANRANAVEARASASVKSAAPEKSSASKNAKSEIAPAKTARPAASTSAVTKSAPVKSAAKMSAVEKEVAPKAASTRAPKIAASTTAAKSAPKNSAAKMAAAKTPGEKASAEKATSAKTSVAKISATKATVAKSSAAKMPVAKTSVVKAAGKPATAKNAQSKASRAAKK